MLGIVKTEQLVLKCLLQNSEFILKFDNNYFISQIAKDLFETLKELLLNNLELTNNHIIAYGNKKNNLIQNDLLNDLQNIEYNLDNFDKYFIQLKKLYAQNNISNKLLKDTLIYAQSKNELDTTKIEELVECLIENLEIIKGKESLLLNLENLMDRYLVAMFKRNNGEAFYSTGDSFLDQFLTTGASPQKITILFGASGLGKSSFDLSLISKQINKKIPCLAIELENDSIMTLDRLLAMRLNIPVKYFYPQNNELIQEDIFDLVRIEKEKLLNNNFFYLVEEPSLNINDIEQIIKEAKRKMKVDYLICHIDLLSMVSEFSGADPKMIEDNMNRLHVICRKLNIHLIGVLQANAQADDYVPKTFDDLEKLRPAIGHIKNSKAFRERGRIVLSVFRKKYYADMYFPDAPENEILDDIMEIGLLKQNEGCSGIRLKYLFDPNSYRLIKFIEEENQQV